MCGFAEHAHAGPAPQPEPAEPQQPQEPDHTDSGQTGEDAQVTIPRSELEALRQKAAECDQYLDMLQRSRADLLNYQKRMRREMEAWREDAIQNFAADLLPVLDDFARATASWDGQDAELPEDVRAFVEGVRMIENQLYKTLARHRIKPMDTKGKPFDPAVHEAVLQQPSDEHPHGTVVEELRRGFTIAGRVLRAAQVVVAAGASHLDEAQGEAEQAGADS